MLVIESEQFWECPNCSLRDRTTEAQPHTRFHACPGLKGLTAPMVPAGSGCRVFAAPREDYVGGQDVQFDADGEAISAVVTERPDGSNDVAVLAPTAHAAGEALF